MRELVLMADAKRKEAWEHTSALMALVERNLTGRACKPSDYNPYAAKGGGSGGSQRLAEKSKDLSILTHFGFKEVKNDGKR